MYYSSKLIRPCTEHINDTFCNYDAIWEYDKDRVDLLIARPRQYNCPYILSSSSFLLSSSSFLSSSPSFSPSPYFSPPSLLPLHLLPPRPTFCVELFLTSYLCLFLCHLKQNINFQFIEKRFKGKLSVFILLRKIFLPLPLPLPLSLSKQSK